MLMISLFVNELILDSFLLDNIKLVEFPMQNEVTFPSWLQTFLSLEIVIVMQTSSVFLQEEGSFF